MELLRAMENRGYPEEYLTARIRRRRAYLVADWEATLAAANPLEAVTATPRRGSLTPASEESVWEGLLLEFSWVFGQMDDRLRKLFAPVFAWFELRTVIIALRNRRSGESRRIGELLLRSLLAESVKRALSRGEEAGRVVGEVAEILEALLAKRGRLRSAYGAEGVAGFERELTTLYLEHMAADERHPVIREFFRCLIDLHNIMALYKHVRWDMKVSPRFIRGGSIRPTELAAVLARKDPAGIVVLAGGWAASSAQSGAVISIETLLLRGLTGRLRRMGRAPEGPGFILDYLWRCFMEARNLSLLIQGGSLARDTVRGELIQ